MALIVGGDDHAMHVEAVLTPAEIALLPGKDLRAATCVVFDVLRATSTMLTALSHGARQIFPVATVAEARALHAAHPDALLGGERGGLRIEGFDLGNSPREYSPRAVAGRDIVMTTTNGTVALKACAGAARVYAGALLNLEALAAAVLRQHPASETLYLVCAGSGQSFALEDGLAAGALLARLPLEGLSNDAVSLLKTLWTASQGQTLPVLRASSNGRRLTEIRQGADVEYCAQVSIFDTVPTLRAGALSAGPSGGRGVASRELPEP